MRCLRLPKGSRCLCNVPRPRAVAGRPAARSSLDTDIGLVCDFLEIIGFLPEPQSGKVKLLTVTSEKRVSLAPDIPTVNETWLLKPARPKN
jgi:hypothetical protein